MSSFFLGGGLVHMKLRMRAYENIAWCCLLFGLNIIAACQAGEGDFRSSGTEGGGGVLTAHCATKLKSPNNFTKMLYVISVIIFLSLMRLIFMDVYRTYQIFCH